MPSIMMIKSCFFCTGLFRKAVHLYMNFHVPTIYHFGVIFQKHPKLKFTKGNRSKTSEDRVRFLHIALVLSVVCGYYLSSSYSFHALRVMLLTKSKTKIYKGQLL